MNQSQEALIQALESILANLKEQDKIQNSAEQSLKLGIQAIEDYLEQIKKRRNKMRILLLVVAMLGVGCASGPYRPLNYNPNMFNTFEEPKQSSEQNCTVRKVWNDQYKVVCE